MPSNVNEFINSMDAPTKHERILLAIASLLYSQVNKPVTFSEETPSAMSVEEPIIEEKIKVEPIIEVKPVKRTRKRKE